MNRLPVPALLAMASLAVVGCGWKAAQQKLPEGDTEIGRVAAHCAPPSYCGEVGFVDCGSAADGPAYYFDRKSGRITGYCGGYCMGGPEQCARSCPPRKWSCPRPAIEG